MGRTYYSKSERDKTFDVNIAGTQILDCLHAEVGVGYFLMGKGTPWERKCAKFIYTKKLSLKTSKALREMSEEKIQKTFKKCEGLFDGDIEEFKEYIKDWSRFLETSNGCEAD